MKSTIFRQFYFPLSGFLVSGFCALLAKLLEFTCLLRAIHSLLVHTDLALPAEMETRLISDDLGSNLTLLIWGPVEPLKARRA